MALSSDALPSVADEETSNNNNAADESDDDSSDDEERVPTPEGNIPDGIDKEVWKELKRVDKVSVVPRLTVQEAKSRSLRYRK